MYWLALSLGLCFFFLCLELRLFSIVLFALRVARALLILLLRLRLSLAFYSSFLGLQYRDMTGSQQRHTARMCGVPLHENHALLHLDPDTHV